jgi:hypothetical protein
VRVTGETPPVGVRFFLAMSLYIIGAEKKIDQPPQPPHLLREKSGAEPTLTEPRFPNNESGIEIRDSGISLEAFILALP